MTIQSLSCNVLREAGCCMCGEERAARQSDCPACPQARLATDLTGEVTCTNVRASGTVKLLRPTHSPVYGSCPRPPEIKTVARIDLELGQPADPHVKSKRAPYSDGSVFICYSRVLLTGMEQGWSWAAGTDLKSPVVRSDEPEPTVRPAGLPPPTCCFCYCKVPRYPSWQIWLASVPLGPAAG